jgi:alcohol dehydrogenase class IV
MFTPPSSLRRPPLEQPKIPIVAVPATLSGAETTPGGSTTVVSGQKRSFWDEKVCATVVCFDYQVLRDAGRDLLATTGMNALAHCAESLYSRTANPVSTAYALEGATALAQGLAALAAEGLTDDALSSLASGAALGGLAISTARVGIGHAICHVLGGYFGVPHGVANAIVLPHALRFNLSASAEEQSRLAAAIDEGLGSRGSGGAADPSDAAARVESLRQRIGVPERLRDSGLGRADLVVAAEQTMRDRGVYFNPRTVSGAGDVVEILRAAW